MSHLAAFYVHYNANRSLSVIEIIKMYISQGWNLNDYGHISFRPLGDKDSYDWTTMGLDQVKELYEIIRKKIEADEDPALVLMWKKTNVGVLTTFFPKEKRIGFLLDINRKVYPKLPGWTDISWYLAPILNPLLANKVGVEKIEFSDMP
jgi:hypothetical protein